MPVPASQFSSNRFLREPASLENAVGKIGQPSFPFGRMVAFGEGWLRRASPRREDVSSGSRSAAPRTTRCAARRRAAGRAVGRRRRGRQRILQRLQELLQDVAVELVLGELLHLRQTRRRWADRHGRHGGHEPVTGHRAARAAGATGPAGTVGEAALKTPCNSVAWSLVSLPLETSPLMRSSILDLRSPGDGSRAAGLVAGAARLQRGIDIGQRRRQRVLIGRTDGAGSYFGLQLILQLLERRLVGDWQRPPRSRS